MNQKDIRAAGASRKKVVATAKRRERVYKGAVEPSVPFCEKGGTTAHMADFSVRKIGTEQSPFRRGGDGGIRTLDLCVANAALSQLSYTPAQLLPTLQL